MVRKRDGVELTTIQIVKKQCQALTELGKPKKLSAAAYLELVLDEHIKKSKNLG